MVAEAPRLTTTRLARSRSRCRAGLLDCRRRSRRTRIKAGLIIGYDCALGEGISRDPLEEVGGLNIYGFAKENALWSLRLQNSTLCGRYTAFRPDIGRLERRSLFF